MLEFVHSGNFKNTEKFLRAMQRREMFNRLDSLAKEGVNALAAMTPKDSGQTASSWGYLISSSRSSWTISWTNTSVNQGVNIAVILQYGHGTGTGGYVQGIDYINPAIRPIFDRIADDVWKAVTSA